MFRAPNPDLHRLRRLPPHVLRYPAVEYVGGADAEGHAPNRSHVWRMRVRADIQLPRQRVTFQHNGVADALRSFAVRQLAMQSNSLLRREVLLLQLELRCQI